jgi:hypothetical protein
MTVRCRPAQDVGADPSIAAAVVVDHSLHTEVLAQLPGHHGAHDVVAPARGKRNDDPDRTAGIDLLCDHAGGKAIEDRCGQPSSCAA